jgi:hypothetical protein
MRRSDRPRPASGPLRCGLSLAIAALLFGGCQTVRETSDGRPMPPSPVEAPQTPQAAPINAIALMFGPKPIDTDADGRPDLIEVEVYLFSRPFPSPTYADGSLRFELFAPGAAGSGQPLGTWQFDAAQLLPRRSRSLFGPCYQVQLNLRAIGLAKVPLDAADLRTSFLPADGGTPVQARSVERIALAGF